MRGAEERYLDWLHTVGSNVAVLAMAAASFIAFFLATVKVAAAIVFMSGVSLSRPVWRAFENLGAEPKPVILMLLDIVETSLLGVTLLVFAFGLRSVFLNKRSNLPEFDIKDMNDLKEYLVGLFITLAAASFLESLLKGDDRSHILGIGLATAAVIIALAGYELILKKHKEPR